MGNTCVNDATKDENKDIEPLGSKTEDGHETKPPTTISTEDAPKSDVTT